MYFCFVLLTVHLEYNRVNRNQLDAQFILSIFSQPLHVSGVSRPVIRWYNRMYTTVGTYYSF
jgi:hypothetical protein